MHHLKIFIDLTRLNKPIGFMLLFWPCAWGLAFANKIKQSSDLFFYYFILFFLGSLLMLLASLITVSAEIVPKGVFFDLSVPFSESVGSVMAAT